MTDDAINWPFVGERAESCASCAAALAVLGPARPGVACGDCGVACGDCGVEYEYAPLALPPRRRTPTPAGPPVERPRPPPRPARPPPEGRDRVPAFVADLLRWDALVDRVERAAFKEAASNWLIVARLAELRILGSGCSGTKGVGHAPTPDPEPVRVDPLWRARYRALTGEARRAAAAVLLDGHGEQLVELTCGKRIVTCALAERVGFLLVSGEQLERWRAKVAAGDSRPALLGARAVGEPALRAAAAAWFGAEGG